jgi:hypothetical protein
MKTTGVHINRYIKKFLQTDEELLALVKKENIKPLVLAPTSYPFVSFTHDEISPVYTKDGQCYDDVYEIVAVVSNDYEETINIVSRIREILEDKSFEDEHISISHITVEAEDEDVLNDAFVQHIVFHMDIYTKKSVD